MGDDLPDSIKELQKYFGNGTSNDVTNVFYKFLHNEHGLPSQAKQALKQHLIVSDWYGYDAEDTQIYVKNMKLISETKVENEEDLTVLRSQLHNSNDFQTELLMGQLLNNRDDSEEATTAFDKAFITLDNSRVQLYYTDDSGVMSGVVVAAKRKDSNHAVYLVFVTD
ncbi:Hypothetical predicted protein [Paramuricea clavata]|uniref:Uncharacterized protein n=1 Tax=Paramuricea clavata TaxID=317549 RepID=A0A6S7H9C3_PARCT|nr:Hypothetical predicted protein [Paramuricea clavata]